MFRSIASLAAVLLGSALVLSGCNGSSGGYSPAGGLYTAGGGGTYSANNPVASDLVIQVTNNTSAVIDVTVDTTDESLDVGQLSPGDSVSFDAQEFPSYAMLSATAVTADASGGVPDLPGVTLQDGTDYDASSPFAGVEWSDAVGPAVTPFGASVASGSSTTAHRTDLVQRGVAKNPNAHRVNVVRTPRSSASPAPISH